MIKPVATACAVFALLGAVLFANALDNPFHYDDKHSIEHNKNLRSLGNIPLFFSDLGTFSSERRGTMFRPLLLSTYAANYALHENRVEGYRVVNLVLHVLCSTLLFALVAARGHRREAWALGLVFLLHPIHGEPVNYISSRSDLLVGFLYLLTLVLVTQKPRASVLTYGAALLSKSVAITLPLAVAGWALAAGHFERMRRYLALLALVSGGYLVLIAANRFLTDSLAKAPRSFDAQLWTQSKALVYSLWLCIMPAQLSVDHPFAEANSGAETTVVLSALLIVSLGAMLWFGRRRIEALAAAFFALVLLPTTLMPLNILVSERRLYLASAGLLGVGIWAWGRLAQRRRRWALVVGGCVCICMAQMTWARNPVWASEIALWEDAVAKGPNAFRARANLGLAYGKAERWSEAIDQLERALAVKPDYADAWVELGNIYHDTGQLDRAERAYRRALEANPTLEGVYFNLGNLALGRGRTAAAIGFYRETLKRNPDFVDAYNNLGQAYEAEGEVDAAREQYAAALERDPNFGGAWYNLGALYERQGQVREAWAAYRRAGQLLRADPDHQIYADRAEQAVIRLERLLD